MECAWSVSKLSTESVGSRRELVANCVHTADATQLNSCVASASAVVYWALSKAEAANEFLPLGVQHNYAKRLKVAGQK